MISKELREALIERSCQGDESARSWLEEEYFLPTNLCDPSRTVQFVHTSMMNEPIEVEYYLNSETDEWQTINPDSDFATMKFKRDEICSTVYWS